MKIMRMMSTGFLMSFAKWEKEQAAIQEEQPL
jgi:hypothetical protein